MYGESPAKDDPDRFCQVHRGTIVNVDVDPGVMREDAEKLRTAATAIDATCRHLPLLSD